MNVRSVAAICFSSVLFKNAKLLKSSLRFTERRFQIVAGSREFFQLGYESVLKVFSSSELNIDTELEVVSAADAWLSHNIVERRKHAKSLLLTVRLGLLSEHALKHVLEQKSCFNADEGCVRVIKEVLNRKSANANVTSRYCKQNDFDFFFCGGYLGPETSLVGSALTMNASDCTNVKHVSRMKAARKLLQAVRVKDQIFVFQGVDERFKPYQTVEKYSCATNSWQVVAGMHDDRILFCACSLVDNVYVVGGLLGKEATSTCLSFDAKSSQWREVARMKKARFYAGCCSFQGRVVASGGQAEVDGKATNSVEVFDHVRNAWTCMPAMNRPRKYHKQVAVGSKLYVVGGPRSVEVFDWISGKFAYVVSLSSVLDQYLLGQVLEFPAEVFAVGDQLVLFGHIVDAVFYYDVTTDEWREQSCEIVKRSKSYCGVKIPHA